jgi:hypothetical protein
MIKVKLSGVGWDKNAHTATDPRQYCAKINPLINVGSAPTNQKMTILPEIFVSTQFQHNPTSPQTQSKPDTTTNLNSDTSGALFVGDIEQLLMQSSSTGRDLCPRHAGIYERGRRRMRTIRLRWVFVPRKKTLICPSMSGFKCQRF